MDEPKYYYAYPQSRYVALAEKYLDFALFGYEDEEGIYRKVLRDFFNFDQSTEPLTIYPFSEIERLLWGREIRYSPNIIGSIL